MIFSWILIVEKAFPLEEWWTDAIFSLQRVVFNIMVLRVEFMADKLALEQIFLRILASDQRELKNFLDTTDEFVL
jgi:Zn-dependent membrane protease YugP